MNFPTCNTRQLLYVYIGTCTYSMMEIIIHIRVVYDYCVLFEENDVEIENEAGG